MNKQVVLIADVGGPSHDHVGDEAILTARLAWLRREFPDRVAVAVSEDPAFTARRHHVLSLSEPELPPWADRTWIYQWRFSRLIACFLDVMGRWRAPALARLLAEIRRSAVLLICGGGNLTSSSSRLLRFRSLLAGYAEACGVPVVVTGQQIGPALTPADDGILRRWLPHAALVGVRDAEVSAKLGRELGVAEPRLLVTGDDALELESVPVHAPWVEALESRPVVIGLSLHNPGSAHLRQEWLAALTAVLAPWLRECQAETIMLPHLRAEVPHRCDVHLAREFATASGLAGQIRVVDSPDYRDVHIKYLTGLCDFVVTTRFHEAVFALTTGVPVMALSYDDYTDSKFNGLFRYFGLDWPVKRLSDSDAADVLHSTWRQRADMAAKLADVLAPTMRRFEASQQIVCAAIKAT